MITVQLRPPRGLAPALVLVAAIWRAQQLVDAAGVAHETYLAHIGNPDLDQED